MQIKTFPLIAILTPKKWKDGAEILLLDLLLSRGIKAGVTPPGTKPADATNFNLFVHLGDTTTFAHRLHKFEKFGVCIGYEQTNAWIFVNGEELPGKETTKTFLNAYNELVSSDVFSGILKQASIGDLSRYWKNLLTKINRINPMQIEIPLLVLFDENKKQSYWERVKSCFRIFHSDWYVPKALLYNYGVLIFIKDYLDSYLRDLGINREEVLKAQAKSADNTPEEKIV